ncbi:hypothetical protein [Halomonas cerina]|uniref:ElaB/YqjD/DUF883 family membrane-anchored ribosome-binding protein n=1 Tax=Halomonas cerina TaxID=447424 RepID=A0A839VF28_9GAMM|nr:hypothetical protein [Halomonas cerina]MBB3192540.1 ElaB/YqjD/DUF883 family membrane-anchored ribosome-binding protein [Halomonas cerina]
MHGKDGDDGDPGHAGGKVRIACAELGQADGLTIRADGGHGGDGQPGQDGGNGGRGGPGFSSKGYFFEAFGLVKASKGGPGGKGGDGGKGGEASDGGAPGVVVLTVSHCDGQGRPQLSCQAGKPGTPGDGGDYGHRGDGGPGGEYNTRIAKQGPKGPMYQAGTARMDDGAPGHAGSHGKTPDSKQKQPDGKPNLRLEVPLEVQITAISRAFTDPEAFEHVEMLYRSARLSYLKSDIAANPASGQQAYQQFHWLSMLLETLLQQDNGTVKLRAQALLTVAQAALLNLRGRRNLFGHASSWVPLGSYHSYRHSFDQLLDHMEQLEERSSDLMQESVSLEEAQAHRVALKSQAEATLHQIDEAIVKTGRDIDHLVPTIDHLNKRTTALSRAFRDGCGEFEEEIRSAFGMRSSDVFTALGTLSFISHEAGFNMTAMLASETGKLGESAIENVVTDSGQQMRKDLVVHRVDLLSDDVRTLDEAVNSSTNGTLSLEDPQGHQLMATRQKVNALLSEFRSSTTIADSLKKIMDDYVEIVTTRNARVGEYNRLIANLAELTGQKKDHEHRIRLLGNEIQKNAAPNLTATRNFMCTLYNHSKEECIKAMDVLDRSFQYARLNAENVLYDTLQQGEASQIDALTLRDAQARFSDIFDDNVSVRQSFPDAAANRLARGILVTLTPRATRNSSSPSARDRMTHQAPRNPSITNMCWSFLYDPPAGGLAWTIPPLTTHPLVESPMYDYVPFVPGCQACR